MQVELLRDHINWAQEAPDEESSVSSFWCFAYDYNDCYIIFKKIFTHEEMKEISSEEGTITRCENGFLVNDPHGGQDMFTRDDVFIFLDLWEKAQEREVNTICDYPDRSVCIQGMTTPVKLRKIFNKDGTQMDAAWFYDTDINRFMWVLPENFFRKPKEELAKTIEKLESASHGYCEKCNKIQLPFREQENTPIGTDSGFSEYGCFHFSQEQTDSLNEKLKADRAEREAKKEPVSEEASSK